MCGNDEMAIGALSALRAGELRVPADIAVTGFDDIAAAHHVRPALTTVRQPMRELGEESVRMLLDRINDQAAPRQSVVLPTDRDPPQLRCVGPDHIPRAAGSTAAG